jgi:DNA polymerase III epsilon subunit-like protein
VSASREIFVSVDVETAGPIPGEYSMLSIGACNVDNEKNTFSCELKPINRNSDLAALKITGLSLEVLEQRGLAPKEGMERFAVWATDLARDGEKLVFVGFNAPFDWSFVNYYFHRFFGRNPFGFTALDIKAYYMGVTGCDWADTRSSCMVESLKPTRTSDHQALGDALFQAELFRLIRETKI